MSAETPYQPKVVFDPRLLKGTVTKEYPYFTPGAYPFVNPKTRKPLDPFYYDYNESLPYKLGKDVRRGFIEPFGHANRKFWSEPGQALLGGAGLGLAGGAIAGKTLLRDRPVLGAILGALLGTTAAGGSHFLYDKYKYKKQAFVSPMQGQIPTLDDPMLKQMLNKVRASNQIDFSQKQSLIDLIKSLDPSQLNSLASVTRGVGTATVVFVIAKFLAGLGLKTSLITALLSGAAGALSATSNKNKFGQSMLTTHNNFGKPYFLG